MIIDFKIKLNPLPNWISFNQLTINWSKTKFMLLTKKRINKPKFIEIVRNEIEVVTEFKLLGVIIDDKLQFNKHIDNLKSLVK